jgi:ATP-dependent RNA/DNA helicase IGHMBP2
MLTIQYRMNTLISAWISSRLYESKLEAHESVAKHLLADLPGVERNENTESALVLIDTDGCDMRESIVVSEDKDDEDESSKANEGEANIACRHVNELIEAGLRQDQIGVITPYNLQMELIKAKLQNKYPLVLF